MLAVPTENHSNHLGGDGNDAVWGITLDEAGNIVIAGETELSDFPTLNALDATYGGGVCGSPACLDAFATHLDLSSSILVYSTYLGGSGDERGQGIAVDSSGSALIYSTYLGGSGEDYGNGIALDEMGGASIIGYTLSSDFPTTPGTYDTTISGAYEDAFVARISQPVEDWAATIDYTYDPLYRLTGADYSTGEFFYYTYDSAGNRLSETTAAGTTSYTYDIANRLTSAGRVTYTWDNNGNLLSDGVNTYTYTSNKLSSITGNNLNLTFQYNGLGERVSQTVNGVTTNFTVDLNAGLSQVLSDGTNIYLYGVGRIAQVFTSGELYFLVDALGSVRQLVDANGSVQIVKNYEPYGEVLSSIGNGMSNYGFTGEWTDSYIKYQYLRSRWYAPQLGRFVTKDSWQGDFTKPISLNKWIYALANPQRWIDDSGLCPKPTDGTGKVICIDLFIKTATILSGTGYGDGRDFSYDSPPEKSRGYIYVYLDQQNKLDHSDLHVDNPSCTTFGCFGPYPEFNKSTVKIDQTPSEIYVSWSLLNGFSGFLRKDAADAFWRESHGIGQILSIASKCGSILIASIDGNLTLDIDANDGRWYLKRLDRDPYPSLEIYYYEDGEYLYTISKRDEWPSGNPMIGLSPLAPNDKVP